MGVEATRAGNIVNWIKAQVLQDQNFTRFESRSQFLSGRTDGIGRKVNGDVKQLP
jgi:hypothetical protein